MLDAGKNKVFHKLAKRCQVPVLLFVRSFGRSFVCCCLLHVVLLLYFIVYFVVVQKVKRKLVNLIILREAAKTNRNSLFLSSNVNFIVQWNTANVIILTYLNVWLWKKLQQFVSFAIVLVPRCWDNNINDIATTYHSVAGRCSRRWHHSTTYFIIQLWK